MTSAPERLERPVIRVLPPGVAARIAAGEVIERPASVVKELIENALDAGARRIEVELEGGGSERIRVRDDGHGIPVSQLADAFERHATSKLRSEHDLQAVRTLGFRGEALAAIVAAADVDCTSRATGEPAAAVVRFRDGRPAGAGSAAAAGGTVVDVRALFAALPARRRFLRTARGETRAVAALLTDYALARPGVAFRLASEGRELLATPGDGDARAAVAAVYGLEVATALLPIEARREGRREAQREASLAVPSTAPGTLPESSSDGTPAWVAVGGLVSPPSLHRGNRSGIHLFANGRAIESRSLVHSLESAYGGALPSGRHPLALLLIEVPPARIDVNVHPRKAEVRFRDERLLYAAIHEAVSAALAAAPAARWSRPLVVGRRGPEPPRDAYPDSVPSAWDDTAGSDAELHTSAVARSAAVRRVLAGAGEAPSSPGPLNEGDASLEPSSATQQGALDLHTRLPALRPLGQLDETYLVAEEPGGLVLIDQHAAHERVLYERALASAAKAQPESQRLLEPVVASLGAAQAALAAEEGEALAVLGFELEALDGGALLIRALPAALARSAPVQALADYLDRLEAEERLSGPDRAAASLACRAAVMAGDRLDAAQQRELLTALEACAQPQTCPHGRPTVLHLSSEELRRSFGRSAPASRGPGSRG